MKKPIAIAAALIVSGAGPACAHHSLAPFNRSVSRTIKGTVKSFNWSNPHVRLVVVVEDGSGAAKVWDFEGGSVNRLANSGFNRSTVSPGDKVSVIYNPKRDGSIGGFFVGVKTPSGKTYNLERSGPGRGGAEVS